MVINKPTMQHTIDTMFSMSCSQPAVVTTLPINAPHHFSALLIFETSFLYDERLYEFIFQFVEESVVGREIHFFDGSQFPAIGRCGNS